VTSPAVVLDAAAPSRTGVRQRTEAGVGWLCTAPLLIGLTLFLFAPSLAVVVMAFTDWHMGSNTVRFAGFGNFSELLADRVFRNSAWNTLLYGLFVTPISVALGVWLAALVEGSAFGRAFFRSAFFLPVVSTTVAMAIVWEFLLHPTLGPMNGLLGLLGLPRQNFLGDAGIVLPTLAAIGIWENVGFNMVLVIAGLKAIPSDLYEAASIEGADRPWERFWTVTFPLLGPTLLFVVVISFLRSFRVFETVAALTQGGPRRASEVLLFTIYQEGFVFFRVGYASALTVVFVLVLLALTLVQVRVMERRVHYG
jgi:multiple sugar transport system permease protein